MEQIDNNKIAMSLLMQCAWLWEHCISNTNEGVFKLGDVCQGFNRRNGSKKVGYMTLDLERCKCWGQFGSGKQPIEGMTYDKEAYEVVLKFGTFQCSYPLSNVFYVAERFCKQNSCRIVHKTRFVYEDGKRYVVLPDAPMQKSNKPKAKKTVPCVKLRQMHEQPLSPAEQLRQALLSMQRKAA